MPQTKTQQTVPRERQIINALVILLLNIPVVTHALPKIWPYSIQLLQSLTNAVAAYYRAETRAPYELRVIAEFMFIREIFFLALHGELLSVRLNLNNLIKSQPSLTLLQLTEHALSIILALTTSARTEVAHHLGLTL